MSNGDPAAFFNQYIDPNFAAVGWGDDDDDYVVDEIVEQPVVETEQTFSYVEYECPAGYVKNAWGQCVAPAVTTTFFIEQEILYLYPNLIFMHPELRMHPEWLFRFHPELRTRYAGARSVAELRNRYQRVHHTAPPARPPTAPRGGAGGGARRQPAAPPTHLPTATPRAPTATPRATAPTAMPTHPAALATTTPTTPTPPAPKGKSATATTGAFGNVTSYSGSALAAGGIGALIALASGSKHVMRFAIGGALLGVGVDYVSRARAA